MEIQKTGSLYVPVSFECLCRSVSGHKKSGFAEILSGTGDIFRSGADLLWDLLQAGVQADSQQHVYADVHWICDTDPSVL